ncbi:MAG: hypothetical protein QOF02_649 [Blastocatellia bacterium]|jgi:hypothetical protein|nr:hypothetical protein [Blastocatellia bacterium]
MTEQTGGANKAAREESVDEQPLDNEENELEAEQESAAAMDADVPQPPGADETTEGQPS